MTIEVLPAWKLYPNHDNSSSDSNETEIWLPKAVCSNGCDRHEFWKELAILVQK